MFETTQTPDRAMLIQPLLPGEDHSRAERLADELHHLARTAGLLAVARELVPVGKISPATYLGSGRVEALAQQVAELEALVVVCNVPLSPVQQRNLERALKAKVVDRTGLILEIFAARARTREGRMQVELASLLYQQSRLVRSWTHLERQRGGVGLRGGPGERQIEIDRRLIRDKITRLEAALKQVARTRTLQRRARREIPLETVALVGYTNAGKSTLFNRLTAAGVDAEDKLFATLDPTMRGVRLPSGGRVILADTVGFIRDLPHQLVAAFRATLEEVLQADLLLHLVDVSDPEREEQMAAVAEVLAELEVADTPTLTLYNKVDQLPEPETTLPRLLKNPGCVALSATTGSGVPELLEAIERELARGWRGFHLRLPSTEGALLARLYREGRVTERREDGEWVHLAVALPPETAGRLAVQLKKFASPT